VQCLKDNALVFFGHLPLRVQSSYQLLADRLMTRFGRKEPSTCYRRRLQVISQKAGESLEEYAERVQNLAFDGFPDAGADSDVVETIAADAFLRGCTDKGAVEVAMHRRPETVAEALDLVKEASHNLRLIYGNNREERKVRQVSWEPDEHAVESAPEVRQVSLSSVEHLAEQLMKLAKQMQQPRAVSPGRDAASTTCFRCGETGHFRRAQRARVGCTSPCRAPGHPRPGVSLTPRTRSL